MSHATAPAHPPADAVRFKSRRTRQLKDRLFVTLCIASATLSIFALVTLLTSIIAQALGFEFDHWFPSLLLGAAVLTISVCGLTIAMLMPALVRRRLTRRISLLLIAATCLLAGSFGVVAYLWQIRQGRLWLTWEFLTGVPSRFPDQAGIWPAMIGTLMICTVCALTAIPIGVATAILLEEFKPRHPWLAKPHAFIQLNITNLAGVPSIVYGILGLTLFVQFFNAFGTPLNPAFEFGVTRYDRFLTEAGQALHIPVTGRDTPPTDPRAVDRWLTDQGEPITIQLIDRDAFMPRQQALDQAHRRFADALEDAMRGDPSLDAAGMNRLVDRAWAESGLTANVDTVRPQIVEGLLAARQMDGRDARRARRGALQLAEQAERQVRFSGLLLANAMPARLRDTAPWYIRIPLGRGVLAGGLTLMLVVLPIVIIASQEALRAVPRSMRYASLALGATPWQTVWKITLPTATPGIMTGTILAMSRAVGEAAPILVIAGIVYITFIPGDLMDDFTAMPLQIFNWAGRPQADFHSIAAAGIIVLMTILLLFNAVAVIIRQRTQKQY